jgi:hypothetical protein
MIVRTAVLPLCAPAGMQHLAALPSRGCSHCAVPGRSHSLTFEPLAGDSMVLAPAWSTPGTEPLTQRLGDDSCTTSNKQGSIHKCSSTQPCLSRPQMGQQRSMQAFLTLLVL